LRSRLKFGKLFVFKIKRWSFGRNSTDKEKSAPIKFEHFDVAGCAAFVHTGWSRHWTTEQYFHGHPFLNEEAARVLRDRGAVLVGIDSLNLDSTDDGRRPVHTTLLGADIRICEHLRGLEALPADSRFPRFR
jgi:kynurenine formamidase